MIEEDMHTAQREACCFTGRLCNNILVNNSEVKKKETYGCIVHDKIYTMHVEN